MSTGKSFRFIRNVGWSLLGPLGVAALNFFLIPYLVGRMGIETYGLYILMHAAASYLLLFSFGAAPTTAKYVAQFFAARDGRGVRDILRYSASLHALGALLGAALLGFGARFWIARVFQVPAPLIEPGIFVLRCAAFTGVFVALTQFAVSVMQGLQRFEWQNLVAFLQNGLMTLGAAGAVGLGLGLAGCAAWYAVLNVGICLVAQAVAWRLLRPAAGFAQGRGLGLGDMTAYSLSLALGPMAWIVTFHFDKIFIARGASMHDLTLYAVPSGLLQRLQLLPAVISTVLMPMMSEVEGPEAGETVARMYVKSVRFLLWAVLPALALLFVLMPQFLTLWLGAEFGGRSVWPARILVLAQVFYLLIYIPNSVALSRGRPWYLSAVAWAQALISLAAWWWLIPRHGILGAAAGSLVAQCVPACFYLGMVHTRLLKLPLGRYLSESLYAPCVSAGLLLALVFPLHHRVGGWPGLILLAAAGGLLYYGSTWLLLDREDRELLRRFLRWTPRPAGNPSRL